MDHHAMKSATRYSAALVCTAMLLSSAVHAIETFSITLFWAPSCIRGDGALRFPEFTDYLSKKGISFEHIPPRRHCNNLLERKHGVIRSIFPRLLDASAEISQQLAAQQALRIYNELYWSHVLSAYEMQNGLTRPL